MKIQVKEIQKMKLYNVYRLCKKYIVFQDKLISEKLKTPQIFRIDNWLEQYKIYNTLIKIPVLQKYVSTCIEVFPEYYIKRDSILLEKDSYDVYRTARNNLLSKMNLIIELYESMEIANDGVGLDIKLPPCDDLKEYISYLKQIEFIFSQCPFLQCDGEILKFGSVDVGSNWLKLTLATAATCMILNNTAALVDKALILRSHYITIQQQEELLKSTQIKNDLAESNLKVFDTLRMAYMSQAIEDLENSTVKIENAEERDKAVRSIDSLIMLLDKGCEIYATLDSPEEAQALFPEIQGNLELPDNIMKFLEEKTEIKE